MKRIDRKEAEVKFDHKNLNYTQYQYAVNIVRKQRRMSSKWADGDDRVKARLWQDLHEAGRLLAESLGLDYSPKELK